MTNKEYYKERIFEIACQGDSIAFDNRTNEIVECNSLSCDDCKFTRQGGCRAAMSKWLEEEYVEPPVDWTKVAVDTPILVSNYLNVEEWKWQKRYFAKYENGKVYAFGDGATSWSANMAVDWEYAKLYKEE